jgi:hypothetical protein
MANFLVANIYREDFVLDKDHAKNLHLCSVCAFQIMSGRNFLKPPGTEFSTPSELSIFHQTSTYKQWSPAFLASAECSDVIRRERKNTSLFKIRKETIYIEAPFGWQKRFGFSGESLKSLPNTQIGDRNVSDSQRNFSRFVLGLRIAKIGVSQ